ncbi:permease [Pseudanabaena sp. FACHB-2040]|uniref:permease n=1 Tax=Pseudanabaena sp. FACHB-2040 TaxID=2692859 RepID=UPI001685BD81|nr:permease [Pseudanabaena sp. FACHB-2040]MBD0269147.1 permease [Cyanobacteria bacterium Co-bin8]MBD2257097.1 permease [Pseudanabaena sp. FACHB-2040]
MGQLNSGITLFLSLLVEAMPFLLMGVAFSSILLFFVDERKLIAVLPRNPILAALAGSLVGFLFPVCECGNVPVARRLLMQGAPTAVAIGFLLAAPTVNPIVFWATWVAFRDQPEIVFLRLIFTLLIATTIAAIFSSQKDMRPFLQQNLARLMADPADSPAQAASDDGSMLLQSGTFLLQAPGKTLQLSAPAGQTLAMAGSMPKPFGDRLRLMVDNMILELRELGAVLIIGSAIAAFVQVAIPRELVLSLGQGPVTSILAMMILAWVVSICSTVDSFFALSFASTFTSGSLLAFLVFGPMIDLKNISLLLTVFKGRAILYLFVLAGQMVFALSLLMNLYWT